MWPVRASAAPAWGTTRDDMYSGPPAHNRIAHVTTLVTAPQPNHSAEREREVPMISDVAAMR